MAKQKSCFCCGKSPLTKDEIGISKKLVDVNMTEYYCYECLAENFDCTVQDILQKIEDFKEEGCVLFG